MRLAWTWLLLGQNPEAAVPVSRGTGCGSGRSTADARGHAAAAEYRAWCCQNRCAFILRHGQWGAKFWRMFRSGRTGCARGRWCFSASTLCSGIRSGFRSRSGFCPERFTAQAKAGRPRFAYFPFGGGGRQCIGESFAWMEAILTLATIAQRWRIEPVAGQKIELQPKITLRPKSGIRVNVIPRN